MERAFAAPALAHGSTMDRGIIRTDGKIAAAIDVRSPIKNPTRNHTQLGASMRFR